MRNQFRGSRWSEHLKTVNHIDTKAKQEFDKKKKKKLAKQSSIISFVGSKRKSTPQGEISMMTSSSSPSIIHELPISTYTSSASSNKHLFTIDINEDTPEVTESITNQRKQDVEEISKLNSPTRPVQKCEGVIVKHRNLPISKHLLYFHKYGAIW
eukprot:6253030-Ditylum_brightwellii.AAC.1